MPTMPQRGRKHGQRGLSLIEQIMVLAVVATITGLAVPSLRGVLGRSRMQVAQTDLIAGLQHARETAVTSGRRTLFCPTVDGSRCSGDTRWDSGWLLGHDSNGDDQPDRGALARGHGYAGKLAIRSSAGRHIVRFRPDGSARGSNLTLLLCPADGTGSALSVVVANSGRVRGAPASAQQTASCGPPG